MLQRHKKGLKTGRLRPKSPSRAKKRAQAKRDWHDSKGVAFAAIRHSMLRPVLGPVESEEVLEEYRNQDCFLCGHRAPSDPHHIVAGAGASHDEKCNLISLCRGCHDRVQSDSKRLPELLRAKWEQDRWNTDWVRLCELRGNVFPFDIED